MPVIDKDLGWSKLAAKVAQLAGRDPHVLVGVQGSEARAQHQGSDMTVVEVATVHEFGTERVPERSFIRAAIDEQQVKLQQTSAALGRGVVLGTFTPRQALELLGHEAVGIMQQRISDRIEPPNAPSTVARKKSSVPLVDKGQLRGSITHRVGGL